MFIVLICYVNSKRQYFRKQLKNSYSELPVTFSNGPNFEKSLESSYLNMKSENFERNINRNIKEFNSLNSSLKVAKHYTKQQIIIYKNTINIIDCIFSRCFSGRNSDVTSGGAVFISSLLESNSKVTITRTGFLQCYSYSDGGAIFIQYSDTKLYKSCFNQCYSQSGQAITIVLNYIYHNCSTSQCIVTSNVNKDEESSKTISFSSSNYAFLSQSNISHNHVDTESAAIYIFSKFINIDINYFNNNTGQSIISLRSPGATTINQCAVLNCKATNFIFSLHSFLILKESLLVNNNGRTSNDDSLITGLSSSTDQLSQIIGNIVKNPGLTTNATFWCWAKGANFYDNKNPESIISLPPIHIIGSLISIVIIIVSIRLLIIMHNIRVDRARTIAGIPEAYLIEDVISD